jgi:hypothetical protein
VFFLAVLKASLSPSSALLVSSRVLLLLANSVLVPAPARFLQFLAEQICAGRIPSCVLQRTFGDGRANHLHCRVLGQMLPT